jgi:hypothetical protein
MRAAAALRRDDVRSRPLSIRPSKGARIKAKPNLISWYPEIYFNHPEISRIAFFVMKRTMQSDTWLET